MKALKIILFVIVAAFALFLVLGIVAPKDARVERSVEINAPIELVYSKVSDLKKMDEWSPWSKLDTNMLKSYAGEDGTVGSVAEWESDNENVGKGRQEITSLEENKSVRTKLTFIEPWESTSDAYIELDEGEDGGVKVTWGFYTEYAYPMNAMMLFMNLEEMLGGDYEEGLNNLKLMCEEEYQENKFLYDFEIVEIDLSPRTYISIKDTVKWENMQQFFATNFTKEMESIKKAKLSAIAAPSGLYFNWDVENKQAIMAAGIPVESGNSIKGFEMIEIGGKALKIAYYGDYSGSEDAHNALGAYMESNGIEMAGPAIEEYVTDPMAEPDSTKWLTNIYYPIN